MPRRRYLKVDQYNAAKSALAESRPYREVSEMTGVPYGMGQRIALCEAVSTEDEGPPTTPEYLPAFRGITLFQEFSPVEVCPVCGVKVKMPCLACQVRELKQRGKR